jgi:K+-sensing histidine kinase KdpD
MGPEDKNFYATSNQLLWSLARELKSPLTLIARRAELEKSDGREPEAFGSIQGTAEKTLQLIDSYLLMAQSEYGQRSLPLETVGVGSVIYEVARDIAPYAKNHKIEFTTEVRDASVMANREGLKTIIRCLSELVLAENSSKSGQRKKVHIQTARDNQFVAVSVLSNKVEITNKDLDMARQMQGTSHLASAKLSGSGIRLAIADMLANSLGSNLHVRKIDGLKGISFNLISSKQLNLV